MAKNANGRVPFAENSEALDAEHNISYAQVLQRGRSSNETMPNNNVADFNFNNESLVLGSDLLAGVSDEVSDEPVRSEQGSHSSFIDSPKAEENDSIGSSDHTSAFETSLDTPEVTDTVSCVSEITETQESLQDTLSKGRKKGSFSVGATNAEGETCSSDVSSEECSSEEEEEEESEEPLDMDYPNALKWQLRTSNIELPETVTVLDVPGGGKVYLVGTAHFSFESQEDVAKVIRSTIPDVVMVELCKSRVNILSLDEETILEEAKNMNFQKIRSAIQQNGFMQGVLYLLLLNMSANLTKQLGMAPGGEFRTAFSEAMKIPGCIIHLGDRPIHITLQRALATLSIWQKMKLGWYMLNQKEPISKQEVERCKQRDLLEETLAEMTGEFPELSKVFVWERDIFLAYSLRMAATPMPSHVTPNGVASTVVVGVVGIGHVPGIVANWGSVDEKSISPILSIPAPSTSSKVMWKVIRYSMYGLLLYCGYRIVPKQIIHKPAGLLRSLFRSSSISAVQL